MRSVIGIALIACMPLRPSAAEEGLFSAEGVDRMHAEITDRVTRTATWLDAFFLDQVYEEEQNNTRLRLRFDYFVERGESANVDARAKLRLRLPGARKRWSLFINGDETDSEDTENAALRRQQNDESSIGLSYFPSHDAMRSISVSASVKRRDGEYGLFVQPRFRRLWEMGDWNTRFTQKIGYHTETRFETESRLDFERLISDTLFFRATGEVDWSEEDPGIEYYTELQLRQFLDQDTVASYQWVNVFETRPEHELNVAVISATYRKRFWRRWMFYEIVPQVSFSNDRDHEATPGLLLRLEMMFGRGDFEL
jgi:hypothetical protein